MEINNISLPGKIKYGVLFLIFNMLITFAIAQVTVTGKVTGKENAGLAGVSVIVKGTQFGSSTTTDGNYRFTAALNPGNYSLVVSGVGFQSEQIAFSVGTSTEYNVDVQLTEQISSLDEVIVTGTSAGTTRRQIGSYISSVKADDINKGATGNILASLQGKTAGAQISQNSGDPAGGLSVRLRGISSISSSSEPLYIVDGVIVNNATNRVTNTSGNYDGNSFVGTIGQNRLTDINPGDIERIEVLNGAAAAAIYGSRANSGVIQIFTKRGKSGTPQLGFSTSLTHSSLRKRVEVNRAPTKFGGEPNVQTQDILTPALVTTTPVTRYDYQDDIFRNATGTDNTVSLTGGSDKTKYYTSGSYFFNQGIIRNTNFQRYSFRLNLDQAINTWASFNMGLNYINSTANEKPDGNSFFSPMNSVTIIGNFHDINTRDANGNIKAVGERGRINPLSVIEEIKQKQTTSRVLANAGIKLKPFRNFTLDYTIGIDNYSQSGTTLIPPFPYNASDGFYGGGITLDAARNGYASTANNNFFAINHDINATYTANITKDIGSTTQLGFSQQYEKNNYILFQGRGLAPLVQVVNAAATVLPGTDERSELSISGVYLQQNFRIFNQLFITGALRVDGSSVFGENQRNQKYLKLSGSYVLSSANFWQDMGMAKWWDLLKLRVAYGESGNLTGIGAFARFNTYSPSAYVGRSALSGNTTLANPEVKPERQEELEFGADLAFFKNRLSLTFNIYNKEVSDLLINRVVAPTTGFSSLLNNLGSLENKGFEIVLGLTPFQSKNFTWNINGLYNKNKNKAIDIGQALTLFSTNGGAPVAILKDRPIGVFYGTYFARDPSGNLILNAAGIPLIERGEQKSPLEAIPGRDANGLPTGTVLRKIIGDPNPEYTASITNEITYKKIGLRVQIDAVRGGEVFNADWRTRQGVGNGKVAEQEHLGQLPRGYISGIYAIEEWRVDDGSFTKLREIAFSYNVGSVARLFKELTIRFSGRNLFSWDNYKGFDPEVNAGGQSTLLRGIDFGAVPIPKTFSLSVQANF